MGFVVCYISDIWSSISEEAVFKRLDGQGGFANRKIQDMKQNPGTIVMTKNARYKFVGKDIKRIFR